VEKTQKHLHIIGICGVATSALAIAFHHKGWKVTGSDKGFFPPVSTELEKAGISFYAGWHPEKVGKPDVVIIGNASGSQNPETQYVKENDIPIITDAEARGKYFAKKHSIACVGTWGKTSSTALLSHILLEAGMDPSFVIGGISLSTPGARLGDSEWSVIEGDEYKTSPWDDRPKFDHLHATHLLLTSVSWDHADLYPTEESYFKVFSNLVSSVNFIVACKDDAGVRKVVGEKKAIWYGSENADYVYSGVKQTKDGLDFMINGTRIHSPLMGEFQAENITACFAMARELGIQEKAIVEAIGSFLGLKRRLEKRYVGEVTVFDDIAHSPEKASSVLSNLRKIYNGRIIAVFEPNIGGRQRAFAHLYDNAFKDADCIFIPRLSKLKISEDERPMEGDELAMVISKTHSNAKFIENDENLVKELIAQVSDKSKKDGVIVFLGSHGFRGMIESTISSLTSLHPQSQ
jgi:UDP-N-acetylmuramate: L-alanyl-gamma-D-glutamyl-meso-diaminopimelate ligase